MKFQFGVYELPVHDRWRVEDAPRIGVDYTGAAEGVRPVELALADAFAHRGALGRAGLALSLAPGAVASALFSVPVVMVGIAAAAASSIVRPSGEWIGYRKAFAAGADSFRNAMRVPVGRALESDIRAAYLNARRSQPFAKTSPGEPTDSPTAFLRGSNQHAAEAWIGADTDRQDLDAPTPRRASEDDTRSETALANAAPSANADDEIADDAVILGYRAAIPGPFVWIYLIGFSLIPFINIIFIPFLLWAIVFMFAMRIAPRKVIVSDGVVLANAQRLEIRKIKSGYVYNSVLKTLSSNRAIIKKGTKPTRGVNYMAGAALGTAIRDLFFDRPRAATAYHVCVDYRGRGRVKVAKNMRRRQAERFLDEFGTTIGLE
ncbi:MAG: hypothetical protein AAFX08_05700 [Pseudomonadota bacterium]